MQRPPTNSFKRNLCVPCWHRCRVDFSLALLIFLTAGSLRANLLVVNTTSDSGPGSLRQAILDANNNAGADTINFQIPGTKPFTINLLTPLPNISDPVTLDGTTQPGYTSTPVVELNGSGVASAAGLQLNPGSGTSVILGLAINRFTGPGLILNSSSNVVRGNFIGTDTTGALVRGNSLPGIWVASAGNLIGGTNASSRNIVSGNGQSGIYLTGTGATNNLVQGNLIGTDYSGSFALSNGGDGISLTGASGNTINGGNVVSGNLGAGIALSSATLNAITGNYIGLDLAGKVALGNHQHGIYLTNSTINTIGGQSAVAGNVISGNYLNGLVLTGGSSTNLVQGNLIGLAVGGTNALANQQDGIFITGGVANTIGGASPLVRNVISGNGLNGVEIALTNDVRNVISGNYIGTDIAGKKALGNTNNGVAVLGCANVIGGTKIGNGNVISGNGLYGVYLQGTNGWLAGNQVAANVIGLDATGTNILANGKAGLAMVNSAGNQIGGMLGSQRNVISGNSTDGLYLSGLSTSNNLIQGNYVGTDITGTTACPNGFQGISAISVTGSNLIGGSVTGAGNVISGNTTLGITLYNATGFWIQGNYVGLNAAGTTGIKNNSGGIFINGAGASNWIGGSSAGAGNVISGNGGAGVFATNCLSQVVQGNFIGTDAGGNFAVTNADQGIDLERSTNCLLGGLGAGNVVSGNGSLSYPAIMLYNAAQNSLQGNYVGLNAAGTAAIGNGGMGLVLWNTASNQIGGTTTGMGNLISGNGSDGMFFTNASQNTIQGNLIGVAANGTSPLGNIAHGVEFGGNSTNNLLGGSLPGAGNCIAYAKTANSINYAGVRVRAGAFNNLISGNAIYNNAALGIDLGTQGVNANMGCETGVTATDPNHLQNYPVLTTSASGPLGTLIRGSFDSMAGKNYVLEFFASTNGDSSGNGEGQVFLGRTNLALGTTCSTNFSFTLPFIVLAGWVVTATATDPANNTSEFSNWITNQPAPPQASLAVYTRSAGFSLNIPITNLMTYWSDTNALPMRLAGINLLTTNQVALQTNATSIYYPSNSPNVNDQFSYLLTDGFGVNTGLVNILLVGSITGLVNSVSANKGVTKVNLTGIPGWAYNVQRTTNLTTKIWVTRLATNAPSGGVFQFTDVFNDLGGIPPASAYYRIGWHP